MSNSRGAGWGDLHSLATVQAAGWGESADAEKDAGVNIDLKGTCEQNLNFLPESHVAVFIKTHTLSYMVFNEFAFFFKFLNSYIDAKSYTDASKSIKIRF